eukprot:CAMPEP_0171086002 /NCGR_PEP_ID=MMETSP0766_2-20121228/19276_1 /TAXON_ID=439317 /ORGANISM="Gambierdiscus australes, Strain CAWD 149" /LENGTH=145 /DNA_ID=CAMNT_0011543607 /DNA_START=58 /DNA_END=495 /DNA_ORIENTATION=-
MSARVATRPSVSREGSTAQPLPVLLASLGAESPALPKLVAGTAGAAAPTEVAPGTPDTPDAQRATAAAAAHEVGARLTGAQVSQAVHESAKAVRKMRRQRSVNIRESQRTQHPEPCSWWLLAELAGLALGAQSYKKMEQAAEEQA